MRTMSSEMLDAIQASTVRPVHLVELEFVTTTLRLSDYARDLTWNSQTWLGNGFLHPLQGIDETSDIQAAGTNIVLTALDTQLLSLILRESNQRAGRVWFGCLDEDLELIVDPLLLFDGVIDVPEITDDEQGGTITVSFENDLILLERPSEFRYDNHSQQALFSGDRGFEFTQRTADWSGYWGKSERPKYLKRKREKQR